ncbi:MAG: hypothetical protein LBI08_00545 [Methanomassiliicoccaceae archaeon]|jgi:hypothetical protein|nr:hypothetical protein [Methanomassiliicoccaceae archaeon]
MRRTMTQYEMISKRRSVRKYRDGPVPDAVLEEIRAYIDELEQMDGQNARFDIVSGPQQFGAPHCVTAYSNEGTEAFVNVGYCLQDIDLCLQGIGLGSLWYGSKNSTGNGPDGYCIKLIFGNTDVPLRKGEEDFKRMGVNEMSNIDNAVARAVRLAPSARNTQPWQLIFGDGGLTIRYRGSGLLKGLLKKKLSKIDLGIAARCAAAALEHEGKEIRGISVSEDKKDLAVHIVY